MKKFEAALLEQKPDLLIVVGDVNSTVACALVAAKISYDAAGSRPLIAHVEAGLRSFDREMPEEINRIVTDHLADLLFVTEESGIKNLRHEGIADGKIHFVGNTMIDSLVAFKDKASLSPILSTLGLQAGADLSRPADGVARYALLTLHRPSNVDQRESFLNILEGLEELASVCPVVFPAHPRTQKKIADFGLEGFFQKQSGARNGSSAVNDAPKQRIRMIDPLGYLDFLCLMQNAAVVITDSGGIQEETTCLGVPCVTVRENTERTCHHRSRHQYPGRHHGARHPRSGSAAASVETGGRHSGNMGRRSAERILDVVCNELALQDAGQFVSVHE